MSGNNLQSLPDGRPTLLQEDQTAEIQWLAKFMAKNLIARSDAKAVQDAQGRYMPSREFNQAERKFTGPLKPWAMMNFSDHFTGKETFGHYLLNTNSECKIFAFDIDLKKLGRVPTIPLPTEDSGNEEWFASFEDANLRETWLNRAHPARTWIKIAMREAALRFALAIEELETPHITAYTGSKGLHVYALCGLMPAEDAIIGAHAVIEAINDLTPDGNLIPSLGNVFFQWDNPNNPEMSLFEIEVFPKQGKISEDGFGNLLRVPYGLNKKSKDHTFFIDEETRLSELTPASFEQIANSANPR
jgi:hypothetical protein